MAKNIEARWKEDTAAGIATNKRAKFEVWDTDNLVMRYIDTAGPTEYSYFTFDINWDFTKAMRKIGIQSGGWLGMDTAGSKGRLVFTDDTIDTIAVTGADLVANENIRIATGKYFGISPTAGRLTVTTNQFRLQDSDFRMDDENGDSAFQFSETGGLIGIGVSPLIGRKVWIKGDNLVLTEAQFFLKLDHKIITKSGTSIHSINSELEIDESGGLASVVYGINNTVNLTDGDNSDVFGGYTEVQMAAGSVSGNIIGHKIHIDYNAGTVNQAVIGLNINADIDGTVSGTTYMIKLDEGTGIDYGIYQNGSAPNRLGGLLDVVGDISAANLAIDEWNNTTGEVDNSAPGWSEGALFSVLYSAVEAIVATDAGVAASILHAFTEVETNGDSDLDNVTLVNGNIGQRKYIYCNVLGNVSDTWKITPANMVGGTQITFTGGVAGQGCILVYASEGWVVVANNGGVIG